MKKSVYCTELLHTLYRELRTSVLTFIHARLLMCLSASVHSLLSAYMHTCMAGGGEGGHHGVGSQTGSLKGEEGLDFRGGRGTELLASNSDTYIESFEVTFKTALEY